MVEADALSLRDSFPLVFMRDAINSGNANGASNQGEGDERKRQNANQIVAVEHFLKWSSPVLVEGVGLVE